MIESLRIFGILLHKCVLVRKRQWITSIIGEIVLPVILVLCVWVLQGIDVGSPRKLQTDGHFKKQSLQQLMSEIDYYIEGKEIVYAPSNDFTDELMQEVRGCFKNKPNITGRNSEAELIDHYFDDRFFDRIMGIVFDDSTDQSTKHLHYKLRSRKMDIHDLYNPNFSNLTGYYVARMPFVQIQFCLNKSFLKIKSNNSDENIPEIFIQSFPYPAPSEARSDYSKFLYLIVIIFMIPSFIETSKATKEKFVGLNVLMSMNGISNTLNFLSWIVCDLLLLSILCMISVLLMFTSSSGNGVVFMKHGNPNVVFLVLMVHLGHSMTFGIHVSAYFSKSFLLTFVLVIVNALAIFSRFYVLEYINSCLTPYIGIVFPNILLYEAMDQINFYETIGIGIHWNNLFANAYLLPGIGSSTGMNLTLSVIGMIFHFLLAIYVYAIKPGKYGIRKHPLYLFMHKSKQRKGDTVEKLIYQDIDDPFFEPPSSKVYSPGIQIRNLKKTYDICLFNKEKVHALRGISIDFYKGEITSLLGHNGAGKSTLMSILTGMISQTEGIILINSKNLKVHASEILKDVGLCAQEDMYFPSLTVKEQLEFVAMVKTKDKSNSANKDDVLDLIKKLKLFNVKDCLPNSLSGDQKRKLCLGIALVGNPSTLILDEPTARLDYESKRLVWNILLEMRGQKTILISTHDMEEADILGNRIAIMHEGRLRSYGTSLYLKKMIAGQNNIEVILSIERWSDPQRICTELHNEAKIIVKGDKKIIVSTPISPTLPDMLCNLEGKKKELGISSYKMCNVSLEQVFFKVTEDRDNSSKSFKVIQSDEAKLKATTLYMQSVRALFAKKLIFTLKDLTIIVVQILTVFVALVGISTVLMTSKSLYLLEPKTVLLSLDIYYNSLTIYASFDETIGKQYMSISRADGGESWKANNTINLDDALMRLASENLIRYNTFLVAAAEFNKTTNGWLANAFHSQTATYSLPISVNLLWNTIIKNLLGPEYSVSLSKQAFWTTHVDMIRQTELIQSYMIAIIFAIPFYFTVAMFAIHPCRESFRGIKYLQKMSGVSGFTYWGTTILYDLMIYVIIVLLTVIGLICIDYSLGLQLYESSEIVIMILLLMLFAINTLPLVYIVSFINMKTNTIVKLLTFVPMGIVIIYWLLLFLEDIYPEEKETYFIQGLFFIIPHVSFLNAKVKFYRTGIVNAICRRLPDEFYEFQCEHLSGVCCDRTIITGDNCYDRKCQKLLPYFVDDNVDSLKVSIMFLCATPLLYFGILALLEAQLIQKVKAKFAKQVVLEPSLDEQVQQEKLIIFEKIQELKKKRANRKIKGRTEDFLNNQFFLSYELRKRYGKVRAIEDISFRINKGECFGLFGVNRAGKSTILSMITGEEILDHGIMYVGDKDFKNNRNFFLSQIGYCSQHDVSLKCLNSYDHLRLFARLRGIPESQVEKEVEAWIERLNLSCYASLPSGTYSNGNKQRLNIAIALIGNPSLVILDEPTMQVDPGARRSFWNIIKSCQTAGQTFLLASHNMKECEAVCNRMTIMVDGKLISIGTPDELKQRFGVGYDVQIRMNPRKSCTQADKIKKDMRLFLHCLLTDENSGYLMYHVKGAGTTWKKIYDVMNRIERKYDCIDDYLVIVRLNTTE